MTAEILCIGTELLLGNILNTNAKYLSEECAKLGLSVYRQTVVGDNYERAEEAFLNSLKNSDVVITTGGLGPTSDDISKEAVTEALGLDSVFDKESYENIVSYFKKMGRNKFPDINNKQAYIPVGAKALSNKNGTAPAVLIETNNTKAKEKYPNRIIILLPGPPRELIPIFEEHVVPFFKNKSKETIHSVMVKLAGIGESKATTEISDLIRYSENPTVAPYAKTNEVHLRVTAKAQSLEEAEKIIEPVLDEINKKLGKYIYTTDENMTLEDVVVRTAVSKKIKIAVAESCTGGLLSGRIINSAGASECFMQGFVTYSNEAKHETLCIDSDILEKYGAVSEECAIAMAKNAAIKANADIAVSTTGIAGPSGGSDEKPVGLVYVGIYNRGKTGVEKFVFNGNRSVVRENAAACALNLLRLEIMK